MPFTNPAIYYRTNATRQAITADPSDLPAAQILEFTNPDNLMISSVKKTFKHNISDDPGFNPDGTLIIHKQHSGALSQILLVTGHIDLAETALMAKLDDFISLLSIETAFHKFGIFGIAYQKVPRFEQDPSNLLGYTMDEPEMEHVGKTGILTFTIPFRFGGTRP